MARNRVVSGDNLSRALAGVPAKHREPIRQRIINELHSKTDYQDLVKEHKRAFDRKQERDSSAFDEQIRAENARRRAHR